MRKEKKRSPLDNGEQAFLSLSGGDQRFDNIVADVSRHHAYIFGRSVG